MHKCDTLRVAVWLQLGTCAGHVMTTDPSVSASVCTALCTCSMYEVVPFWSPYCNQLTVSVHATGTGSCFVSTASVAHALHTFMHRQSDSLSGDIV